MKDIVWKARKLKRPPRNIKQLKYWTTDKKGVALYYRPDRHRHYFYGKKDNKWWRYYKE